MRKFLLSMLMLAISFSFGASLYAAPAQAGASDNGVPVWVQDALEGVPSDQKGGPVTDGIGGGVDDFGDYFPCLSYDGTYCPINGGRFRCMWDAYNPGLCHCSNNTWICG
ncbi:MAG: hypothetical protein KDI37_03215 [Xanthomonadales bacterium]|nr:hypothetical protein [Xanthomonadales bacterium]MCB1640715.1 hypothetical protein [Xanthomonadales bacterium]